MEEEKKEQETSYATADYTAEIIALINDSLSPEELRERLFEYHANDVAQVLPRLTAKERVELYKVLGEDEVSEIFSYLDDVEVYIEELDATKAAHILGEMDADDAVDALEDLSEEKQQEILNLMDSEARDDIELITSYSEEMVGSKMTTNYIAVKYNESVKQTMKELVKQAADNDNVSTIFVVDENDEFYGAIDLRDLIVLREGQDINSIITTKYPILHDKEEIADCLERLKEYSEDLVPVLDDGNKIVGVISASDVVEAMHEELSEDYVKLAGITDSEDLKESMFRSVKKRLPWLLALLALGILVSSILQLFQDKLPPDLIIIYTFQSLILDMSGNIGTQSLAVTIRVISGEATRRERLKLVFKELRVGALNGLIIGLLAFAGIGIYLQFIRTNWAVGIPVLAAMKGAGFLVSGCIGVSILISMIIASLVGTFTPLFFKRIHIDPAAASGPLITTVNDLVAVCTYYGVSILLFVVMLGII